MIEMAHVMSAPGQPVRLVALVDDDTGVRDSLAFLLEIAGHAVCAYASPIEFLRQCDLDSVRGLVADQHMPGLTGLELASHLRALGRDTPILLVTAAPTAAILAQAAELGISQVLAKPFDDSAILAFVRDLPI